jgi:hypothetical protein
VYKIWGNHNQFLLFDRNCLDIFIQLGKCQIARYGINGKVMYYIDLKLDCVRKLQTKCILRSESHREIVLYRNRNNKYSALNENLTIVGKIQFPSPKNVRSIEMCIDQTWKIYQNCYMEFKIILKNRKIPILNKRANRLEMYKITQQ